jgi:ethanolamine-phosphate cytidylyltransferase
MSEKFAELEVPPGDAALEVLDGRIWVDGCWDFFHHGVQPQQTF